MRRPSVVMLSRVVAYAVAALALCLCVRSYRTGDVFSVRQSRDGQQHGLVTRAASLATGRGRGVIAIRWAHYPAAYREFVSDQSSGWRWLTQRPEGLLNIGWSNSLWGRCGLAFQHTRLTGDGGYDSRATFIGVPLWAALLVLIDPACLLLRRARRSRRVARGQCAACGYDLRFSPGRCPECGEAADN